MPTNHHARRLAGLLLGLALAATACGSAAATSADRSATEQESADPQAGGDYPVTIEHANGTTTIEQRPERVVSLSVQWTDAMVAMGQPPAAYVLDAASGETEPYPWQAGHLDGAARLDIAGEIPFEDLVEAAPDLILVTHAVADPAMFDRLQQIAPTIGLLGDRQVDRWQDQVEVLGRVLADPARAEQVIGDVEQQVADLAAEFPGLAGKTYALANYVPGDSIWVVADPEDGASELFKALGMHTPQPLLDAAAGAAGRVQLSLEQVSMLEADLLAILPNGGDPGDLPGYADLTSVRTGAVAEMVFADVVGINTPTPISVPYVLDLLRPALEAAAA